VPVTVATACDPNQDIAAVQVDSALVQSGQLRLRLAFPRGHDPAVKNTPSLDWSHPDDHTSRMSGEYWIERTIPGSRYHVTPSRKPQPAGPHNFLFTAEPGQGRIDLTLEFAPEGQKYMWSAANIREASAKAWPQFWGSAAAVDFTGSTNPLA